MQEAIFKSIKARGGEELKEGYYFRAVASVVKEEQKRERKRRAEQSGKLLEIKDPILRERPEIIEYLKYLPSNDRKLIEERFRDLDNGSSIFHRTPDAERKRLSRAYNILEARLILDWFRMEQFDLLNQYKITTSLGKLIGKFALKEGLGYLIFEAPFSNKSLYRCIQNATWILGQTVMLYPNYANKIHIFLKNQLLTNKDLYRGDFNYIAETLIDIDPSGNADIYRKAFLNKITYMDSRIELDTKPLQEQVAIRTACLFDVKKVTPIESEIPLIEINPLIKLYKNEFDNPDLRRTISFILLRLNNQNIVELVLDILPEEIDQTNAYYICKYLMKYSAKQFPSLAYKTRTTLLKLSRLWPQNEYINQSASRFKKYVK